MKIAYCGNFKPAHSTETHISATLEDMGHELLRIQEDELSPGTLLRDLTSFGPELFLWTRTWAGRLSEHDLQQIHDAGITTASFHLDLYVPISRRSAMDADPFWRTNYVFTPDGDPGAEQVFKQLKINYHYLKPGVYKPECIEGNYKQELAADIVFVGSTYGYHPEWPYRTQLVEFLQRTYGGWFKIYGAPFRSVRNQELNDVYASAKIVIGDSLCPNFTYRNYWSDRVYETTGRGGFIIHPRIAGLETEFVEHQEIAFYNYGDFEHLKKLIDWYREHDDYRDAVRKRGMSRTINSHTYHDRMKEMLDVIR